MKSGFVPGSEFSQDMIPWHVTHAFTGHYHPHRRVAENATVIGSCMQLNWADEGDERGFLVVDTNAPADFEFIPFVAPRFITYSMCGAGMADPANLTNIPGNFIRVKTYLPGDEAAIREQLMGAGARSVEFVVEKEQGDRLRPVTSDELDIPAIIKEYEEQRGVTPERSKVGQELMK
jgi:DNA repair exonuclease SbcCD nuclease subunit